jgi:guanylate kinase
MDYPGQLYVIAAPSGAGKSSLVKALLELDSHVHPSISHTTRAPRGQEKHGREYYFISTDEFDDMVKSHAFVEWASVHGRQYGTSKSIIEDRISKGGDVILEIDFQGALQIRKIFTNAVLIFILPPSWEELRSRLEVAQAKEFDFVIINELFDRALFDLKAIVHAQRLKFAAQLRARAPVFEALHIS